MCKKLFYLWLLSIRNDHIWFGICFRQNGTNYTTIQRLSVLCVRLLITMSVSALFFGINRKSFVGDYTLLFYESFFGWIPVFLIGSCVEWRKPHESDMGTKDKKEYSLVLRQTSQKMRQSKSLTKRAKSAHDSMNSNEIKINLTEPERSTQTQTTTRSETNENQTSKDDKIRSGVTADRLENTDTVPSDLDTTKKDELTLFREHIELRNQIISNSYILHGCWKYVAYFCIILLSLVCIIITSIWCVYFDITNLEITNNYENDIENSICLNKSMIDISENVWLNYNATESFIANNLTLNNDWYDNIVSESNSFGNNLSTSDRFLLELLFSHLLALFVYSPLVAFFYPVLFNYVRFVKNPETLTEGNFFSTNDGFPAISTMLEEDKVDERGKTIRVRSASASMDQLEHVQLCNLPVEDQSPSNDENIDFDVATPAHVE